MTLAEPLPAVNLVAAGIPALVDEVVGRHGSRPRPSPSTASWACPPAAMPLPTCTSWGWWA